MKNSVGMKNKLLRMIRRKRDKRENDIIDLLVDSIKEAKTNNGEESLKKARELYNKLFKDRGKLYFEKYPDMPLCINSVEGYIKYGD